MQFSRHLYIKQKKRSVHSHLEEEDVVLVCLEGGRHGHHVGVGETVQHVQLVVGVLARLQWNELGYVGLLSAAV